MSAAADPVDARSDEPVRDRLIRSATGLLAESGPGELKVRTIAERAGASTMTVYHHFGGLTELLGEVVTRGYADLCDALIDASAADADPGVQLFGMALAARAVAQRNAHLYDMMFGLTTRGTYRALASPDLAPAAGFLPCYEVFAQACRTLAQSNPAARIDGEHVAAELWSLVHGFVTLELAGHFARFVDPVAEILQPMAVNHFVGMGFDRRQAEISARRAVEWFTLR